MFFSARRSWSSSSFAARSDDNARERLVEASDGEFDSEVMRAAVFPQYNRTLTREALRSAGLWLIPVRWEWLALA